MTIVDMHVHLKYRSRCSNLSVEDLEDTISPKIDAVCLTDHWLLKPKKVNPFNGIKVFYGVEIDCNYGDILAYGLKSLPLKKNNISARYVIDYIHDREGVAACAHPYTNRHQGFGDNVFDFEFDAIELNGSLDIRFHHQAKKAAEEMDIPIIGGSDAHSVRQMNTTATKFEQKIKSMEDIVKAIKNKECEAVYI